MNLLAIAVGIKQKESVNKIIKKVKGPDFIFYVQCLSFIALIKLGFFLYMAFFPPFISCHSFQRVISRWCFSTMMALWIDHQWPYGISTIKVPFGITPIFCFHFIIIIWKQKTGGKCKISVEKYNTKEIEIEKQEYYYEWKVKDDWSLLEAKKKKWNKLL